MVSKAKVALVLVPVALLSLFVAGFLMAPISADPILNASVGDRYAISTVVGEAKARINGEEVSVPASVELLCEVSEVHGNWIFFRIVYGTIKINETVYAITSDWWVGAYYKVLRNATYEGRGEGEGGTLHFVLRSRDRRPTHEGCFLKIWGTARDPEAVYWSLDVKAYRTKVD